MISIIALLRTAAQETRLALEEIGALVSLLLHMPAIVIVMATLNA
jgi:hypothetical protein